MATHAYEIFKTPEGVLEWDNHIRHVGTIDEFTDEQKELAREALSYLRQPDVLGEAFLSRARQTGHPLYGYFRNTAPWTRRWLTRFAGAFKDLWGADGFSTCVNEQIKSAEKFDERESVLEIAYKFFRAGFEVSFDPATTVYKPRGFTGRRLPFRTAPDLKIVGKESGEEIFVEVSELGESDISKQCGRTYHTVSRVLVNYALHERHLFPRARVRRPLDDGELKILVGQLRELIAKVEASNRDQYLINDEIEACLAPAHQQDIPEQWGAERGITSIPIEGPSIPLNDPFRIKRIIRKEQEQLPEDKPGIVVITTDWTLLFLGHGVGTVVSELEDVLTGTPKLSCAIVACSYQGGDEEAYAVTDGQHTAIKRVTEAGLTEQTAVSINPACTFPLAGPTFDRVRGAFIWH